MHTLLSLLDKFRKPYPEEGCYLIEDGEERLYLRVEAIQRLKQVYSDGSFDGLPPLERTRFKEIGILTQIENIYCIDKGRLQELSVIDFVPGTSPYWDHGY